MYTHTYAHMYVYIYNNKKKDWEKKIIFLLICLIIMFTLM